MRTPTSTTSRLAALVGVSAVVLTAGAFPAAAATSGSDGDVQVVNTETVQAYTDANGEVQTKRIYEQLALTGTGAVDLANPITTSGLRNLDGFGGFDVNQLEVGGVGVHTLEAASDVIRITWRVDIDDLRQWQPLPQSHRSLQHIIILPDCYLGTQNRHLG